MIFYMKKIAIIKYSLRCDCNFFPKTIFNIKLFVFVFIFYWQGLTAVDVTDDSSLIAGGFADSTVRVWSVTPKKLRSVKQAAGN